MYEKIIRFIYIGILLVCLLGTGIQSYRLEQTRNELEQYRDALSAATNREQLLTDAINECWNSTTRTNDILHQSATTIGEIREQISQIRKEYENMEDRLCVFWDDYNSGNFDNNSEVKE